MNDSAEPMPTGTDLKLAGPMVLSGFAVSSAGFEGTNSVRSLIRIQSAESGPIDVQDAAVVRSQDDLNQALNNGFGRIVFVGDQQAISSDFNVPIVHLPLSFDYLAAGDIIGFKHRTRRVRALYRNQSSHNAFLVTERCDNYCLMCSQPPRGIDDSWILDEIQNAIPLVTQTTRSLGFTGGEPLLNWQPFIEVLKTAKQFLPDTAVHVLTNGRAFSQRDVVDGWSAVQHPNLAAGIPLYSSSAPVHDYVVQAEGAFDETLMGILRLKDAGQKVEIRVVLHALTAPDLVTTCSWIARNLPFVDHVALMGMENTGFALANQELLWIDPIDYQADLATAVERLVSSGLHVSIYNLPRCLLDRSVWRYAVQSISDWKNAFPNECKGCSEREACGGFFSTGRPRLSRGIKRIVEEDANHTWVARHSFPQRCRL